MGRVLANGLGNLGSIPGWVIPKTPKKKKKWYWMLPCLTLSIIRYGSRIKWSNPGNRVAPSPTLQCSSYWKGSLQVALDYSCHFTLLLLQMKNADLQREVYFLKLIIKCPKMPFFKMIQETDFHPIWNNRKLWLTI